MANVALEEEDKMSEKNFIQNQIENFCQYLIQEEKSTATIEKYLRDVRAFAVYIEGENITKETVLSYKKKLMMSGYAVRSINSMLASLNCLLGFLGMEECKVKIIKQQKEIYCAEEKELTKDCGSLSNFATGYLYFGLHKLNFNKPITAYTKFFVQAVFSIHFFEFLCYNDLKIFFLKITVEYFINFKDDCNFTRIDKQTIMKIGE